MFHYNHTYSNVPPQPSSFPRQLPYVSTTLKMLYDEIPPRIHFCAMCGGPLSADIDVNVDRCLKDEKEEKWHWEGINAYRNNNDSGTAASDEDTINSVPSKWFERFRGIVVKNHNDWAFSAPDLDSNDEEFSEEEDSEMGDTSEDDGALAPSATTENDGGDMSSPSSSGPFTPIPPRRQRNRRTFSGISTRLTGVGYVSESESEFGVLPHPYAASVSPDNDDGSEEEYQFYTAVNDNAERGIEMIPVHEICWDMFMKAVRYWCEDAGVKLYDGTKWWLSSDVVWRFFTVGYWDSAVDERLQMVRWAYGKRIVENHQIGRWEVRKGEGWWLSEPSDQTVWRCLAHAPNIAVLPTHPTAPLSQLTPSSCPPSLTSPIHYPPFSNDIFNTLPADIALHIFTFLPSRDICSLRVASRPMSAVHLPQSLFRRVLNTEYRFSGTTLAPFLSGSTRYTIDWRAVLISLNRALRIPGPFKNLKRIYGIIERLTEELCETAPRTLKELRKNEVDWEKFTFTLHDGGLVRGYDVQDSIAETALFEDNGVTRINVYKNPSTGRMTGLSFLGETPGSERRFGLVAGLHSKITNFDKILGFIVALGTGSRIMGIQFLLMIDGTTVRTEYFGLPPDFESGETGVGYYKLVIPRMFRQEHLVGITGLCDQHGIRAIGLLAPLKVLQDEYLPLPDHMIMDMPSSSAGVYDETPMVRTYTGGDDDHKPVTGPWRALDVPEGLISSVGNDCDIAFAGRVAGNVVQFQGVIKVSGWWDDHGLRGLLLQRHKQEGIIIGEQSGEFSEHFPLDFDNEEMIEGTIVTGGLREGATSLAFVTNLGRCSEFFGPKFIGCPTHFVPGRGPLARVEDRVVSALHYAYSNENKRFTRLGVVAAIPAVKEFGKGKGKEAADMAAHREHRELMLKSAQTILPFESRDAQGNLWEDVMPSANEFVIEKDKNRPDMIDGGWITWCGTVWTQKALRRIEVWGEVRGVRFTFIDGTAKGFGLLGRGDKVKTFEFHEPEGRWLVSCSWGKVKAKTSWAGEHGSGKRGDADYRDEEDLDDDDWDCTEVTEMKFRTRVAQGNKPKTLPAGYKINHTVTSIRGLAAIFSLPYAPQYLQKLPRPKVVYRSGHKHPTHPLYPNSTTIATPPIPFLRKYEYEFFDGDNGEKLEAIIAYMGVGAWKPFKGLRFRREGSGWGDVFGEVGETMAIFELEGGRIERAFYRMGLGPWLDAVAFATATKASPYFGKERRGAEYEIPMNENWIPIGVYSIRTQVTHVLGNYGPEGYIDHVKNQFGLFCRAAQPGDNLIRATPLGEPSPSSEPITEFFQPSCSETGRLWRSDVLSLPRNSRMAPLIRSTHFKAALQIEEGNIDELSEYAFLDVEHKRTFALFDPERLKRIYVSWRYTTLPVCGRKVAAICHVKFRDFEKMDEILIGDPPPYMNATRIRSLTRNGEDSGAKGWKVERIDIDGLGGERITQVRYVFNPWLCAIQLKTNFERHIFLGLAPEDWENEPYYDAHVVDVQDGEEITGMHVDTTWIVDRAEEKYCDKIGVIFRPCVEV